MSFRPLEMHGRFDSPPECKVTFDGRQFTARKGEPLAVTLLAHGVYVLGRSSKYHRSRGYVCGRGTCGNCLAQVDGLPNQRLCMCHLDGSGAEIEAQNTVGSASFDLLGAIDWLFSDGFDHHHFMTDSRALNRVAVKMAHKLAGLGKLPLRPPVSRREPPDERHVQLAIIGGGVAGRAVGTIARKAGLSTLIVDALPTTDENVLGECLVLGFYDDRVIVASHRNRELRITADAIVFATGAHEQVPPCPGNDTPGLLLMRAALRAVQFGVLPGKQVVIAVDPKADASVQKRAAKLCDALVAGGAEVVLSVGPAPLPGAKHSSLGPLTLIDGAHTVKRVRVSGIERTFDCDAVVWCGRRAPAYELPRQIGLATPFAAEIGGFVPTCADDGTTSRAGMFVAGELSGRSGDEAAVHGELVASAVLSYLKTLKAQPSNPPLHGAAAP